MDIKIRTNNNTESWADLVGISHYELGYKVVCWEYDESIQTLRIAEYHDGISYTNNIIVIDSDKAKEHLLLLGFNVEICDVFEFSTEAKIKANGLIQAGFKTLTVKGSSYYVDGIFEQNILNHDDVEYLLTNNISEIQLCEISTSFKN